MKSKKSLLVVSGLSSGAVEVFKATAELLHLSLDQYLIMLMMNSGVVEEVLGELFPDIATEQAWREILESRTFKLAQL